MKKIEIRRLKDQIREMGGTEIVVDHLTTDIPKNSARVQRQIRDRNPDETQEETHNSMNETNNNEATEISEMRTYLAGVMAAITDFERRLSTPAGTSRTLTDRS